MILERLVVGPFASNCYIVGSEITSEGMIIDPGDEAGEILNKVKDFQLDIKSIVLTHGHIDHIGAVKEVSEATGAEICVHTDDAQSLKGWRMGSILGSSYPALPPPDRLLKGGDSIDIGDLHFLAIHTPGHTPGSVSLKLGNWLFSGDTIFSNSIGRADIPLAEEITLLKSIREKILTLAEDTIIYPGHGQSTTVGREKEHNPFLV